MAISSKSRQRGEALILTLLVLVVLYLGFLYTMRNVMSDTQMAGNNLAQQKNAQVADIALRNLEALIAASSGSIPLEFSATNQPWYRPVTPGTPNAAGPNTTYWQTCLGSNVPTSRCGALPITVGNTALPFSALAVVQPTNRQDPNGCSIGTAVYYDVFLFVQETSAATSATTETVLKLCMAT